MHYILEIIKTDIFHIKPNIILFYNSLIIKYSETSFKVYKRCKGLNKISIKKYVIFT